MNHDRYFLDNFNETLNIDKVHGLIKHPEIFKAFDKCFNYKNILKIGTENQMFLEHTRCIL